MGDVPFKGSVSILLSCAPARWFILTDPAFLLAASSVAVQIWCLEHCPCVLLSSCLCCPLVMPLDVLGLGKNASTLRDVNTNTIVKSSFYFQQHL